MTGEVHLDVTDGVGTVFFENSATRNALSPRLIAELTTKFDEFGTDGAVRAVVLESGGEEIYSSGFDATALSNEADRKAGGRQLGMLIEAVGTCPIPTIAKVSGDVYGAAVELIAACDLRFAAYGVSLCVPAAKLGLIYSVRGIKRFLDLIGPAPTKEILLGGEPVKADRALEMSLVDRVVEPGKLDHATTTFASSLSKNAPLSVRGTKEIIRRFLEPGELSAAERERFRELREMAFESKDFEEGLDVFGTDSTPEFEGR